MKAAIFVAYLRMNSRDSDIVDSQLAIMPPPYLHCLILIREYDMYGLFSNRFSWIGLHDQVGFIGFLVSKHFDISPILEAYDIGE